MSDKKMSLGHRLYTGQISYDFIKHRRTWFTVSGVMVVLSILLVLVRGLTLGIEFTGGTDFQAPMQIKAGTVDQVRSHLNELSVKDLEAQVFSLGDTHIRVQTRTLSTDEVTATRAEVAKIAGVDSSEVTYNAIGASWGKEISRQGIIALLVFTVLVMVLIAVYFRDWKMSIAAIVAVIHDLVITVGIYALVGFTVTPATIIGVLTILGYSLYDTVVVFDKIRENVTGLEKTDKTYSFQANLATNQVLVRSINTTVIGIIPVVALLVAGSWLQSGPLADLGLALLVGMLAGAYSSLFLATPLLAVLKEREPKMIAHREQIVRRAERAQRKAAEREEQAAAAAAAGGVAVATTTERQARRTGGSRAERKGKKK